MKPLLFGHREILKSVEEKLKNVRILMVKP